MCQYYTFVANKFGNMLALIYRCNYVRQNRQRGNHFFLYQFIKMQIKKSTRHLQRAIELVSSETNNTMQFGVGELTSNASYVSALPEKLEWWPEDEQLQYPLEIYINKQDLRATLGNIHLLWITLNGHDNEGNVQVEVDGRWEIRAKPGVNKKLIRRALHFYLDVENSRVVEARDRDRPLICSDAYGSQFYEYVLKDLISNIFLRVITLFRKYGKNDLADRIRTRNITKKGAFSSQRLRDIKAGITHIMEHMSENDEVEVNNLDHILSHVSVLVMLLRGATGETD